MIGRDRTREDEKEERSYKTSASVDGKEEFKLVIGHVEPRLRGDGRIFRGLSRFFPAFVTFARLSRFRERRSKISNFSATPPRFPSSLIHVALYVST